MKYAFIEEQRTQHCIERMCSMLEVSRAGYYEWRGRPESMRSQADAELRAAIVEAHTKSRRTYGRPRIHAELAAQGVRVGSKRIGRIMKSAGIAGVRPRRLRKTTDSAHGLPVAANALARQFNVAQIGTKNRMWAGDITYLPTREGWFYLAVVLDLFSRRVIGWSMSTTITRTLVIDALKAALQNRRPPTGTLFHSDRGSQYASTDFGDILDAYGMMPSMSGKGECWDNAVVESFFGSMKSELGDPVWESRVIARAAIFDYIEIFYNRVRRHSTLGYLSPEQFESTLPNAA